MSSSNNSPTPGTTTTTRTTTIESRPKRQRSLIPACDHCYSVAKKKCDGALPSCSRCVAKGIQCTYVRRFISPKLITRPSAADKIRETQQSQRNGSNWIMAVDSLENSLSTLIDDTLMMPLTPPEAPSVTPTWDPNSIQPPLIPTKTSTAATAAYKIDTPPNFRAEELLLQFAFPPFPDTSTECPPALAPSFSVASPDISLDSLLLVSDVSSNMDGQQQQIDPNLMDVDMQQSKTLSLPPEERERLINKFFQGVRHSTSLLVHSVISVNILHENHFKRRMSGGSNPPPECLILTIFAIASAMGKAEDGSVWFWSGPRMQRDVLMKTDDPSSDVIFEAATVELIRFLSQTLTEEDQLDLVHTVLLLAWFCHQSPGYSSYKFLYFEMAVRIGLINRIDVDPDDLGNPNWTWLDKDIRRRTFFAILQHACFVQATTGGSIADLWNRDIAVKLPSHDLVFYSADAETGIPTLDESSYASMLSFDLPVTDARVNQLYTDFISQVRAADGSSPLPLARNAEYMAKYHELSKMVQGWLENLPPWASRQIAVSSTEFTLLWQNVRPPVIHLSVNRFHIRHCYVALRLHRPLLFDLVQIQDPDYALLRRTLDACADAADAFMLMIQEPITIHSPTPFPSADPIHAYKVAAFNESRTALEAGFFYMLQVHILRPRSHSGRVVIPEHVRARVAEMVGGAAATLIKARAGLQICLAVLKTKNWDLNPTLYESLNNFVRDFGISV